MFRGARLISLAVAGAAVLGLSSEAQTLIWDDNYGGTFNEMGYAAQATGDGFLVLGSTYSYGSGGSDLYLVKTDSLGDTVWSRTYGGSSIDNGYDLAVVPGGGCVMVGSTTSSGAGKLDVYAVGTDSSGSVLWSRTYGGAEDDEGLSVRRCTDGGFVICGTTFSRGAGYNDLFLIRTNSGGDTLWTRTFGGAGGESGFAVRETPDRGYIAVGSTGSFGTGYSSMYVVRLDQDGDSLWAATYGGSKADIGYAVEVTSDDGFIFAGASASFGASYNDAYLVKTDSLGNVAWEYIYGGTYDDRAYAVCQTVDGGYVMVGSTLSYGSGKSDIYTVKVDPLGAELWSRTYGGAESDLCRSVVEDSHHDLFLAGQSYSYSSGGTDVYVVKVDGDDSTPVEDGERPVLPDGFSLAQNYPNPFNPSTTIEYSIPRRSAVSLTIYNLLGQTVRHWRFESVSAGTYAVDWDGLAADGTRAASGVYLYRLDAGPVTAGKKMVLLK